ncbi:MAG: hypothetical protein K2H95_08945 [Bacteroidales bacterium]|nr:hypothetical protein [Bacteroidales bacterium]MDE6147974.1 hypothetical protein [Bacteroidales bacterium]
MFLEILTPERTVLETWVSKVSLPGAKGRFMVLRGHAPLISSLDAGAVTYVSGGIDGKIVLSSGFVEINEDRVTVCAEL